MIMLLSQKKEEPSLAFGGQALMEGVMMRSPTHVVMCVRQPNNEILTHAEGINLISRRHRILRLPFLRGIIALLETLYLSVKGIYFSANVALGEKEKLTHKEFVVVVSFAIGLASLFFIIPFLLTTLLNLTGVLFNIVEAMVRITIFLLYITLLTVWGEFKRILQYHGAEHKAINTYEAGVTLNVANVKRYSRLHPRCGTSFIFIVVIVSIFIFSIMPNLGFAARLAYRLLLIPVIGAVSYELLKLSGKYKNSIIMRALTYPGLIFQCLTTKEPDNDMMEVAIEAVEKVLALRNAT
jgi:uncharacterized protein YqhQ